VGAHGHKFVPREAGPPSRFREAHHPLPAGAGRQEASALGEVQDYGSYLPPICSSISRLVHVMAT
jgi:hypothetical protein